MEPHHTSPGPGMLSVAALRPGDQVAVLAPAGPCDTEDLKEGMDLLATRYRVRPAENLFAREGYLAGSDQRRQEALNRALADRDIRGIFCARGGYGVQRILDQLQGDLLRADPKPIVGFSDITALLCWARIQGVVSIHGPVVTQLPRLHSGNLEHLFSLLEDPGYAPVLRGTAVPPGAASARGPLVGGNLSLLGALAGSPWAPDLRGALLALEEVGEAPYRLDRLLTTLYHQPSSRSTRGLAGVLVGELCGCGDDDHDGNAPSGLAVVAERLAFSGRPLLTGLPFGHGEQNLAFPVGVVAQVDCSAQTLSWEGGVVA